MSIKQTKRQTKRLEPADWIIASGVAAPVIFDMFAWKKGWKTASVRFGEFLIDPKTRLLFILSWWVLTLHLFWKLPLPFQTKLKKLVIGEYKK